jgi:exosortase A-associated hydrolase 2
MTEPTRATAVTRPRFLELNGRRLFALSIEPTVPCTGAALYLPPFAEEMNRCRSHVIAHARAWAGLGVQSLLLDPFGTGDSEGRLIDGEWTLWLEDAVAAARWLSASSRQPLTVWGMRTGALLAAELCQQLAADRSVEVPHLMLWQPVLDGKIFLNQYLRLRIATQVLNESERETTEQIRERLSQGEIIEVGGYPLTGKLADQIASRNLAALTQPCPPRVSWIEVVAKAGQAPALPTQRLVERLKAAGTRVDLVSLAGPMVWQVHERVDAPELQAAALQLVQETT